MIKYNNTSCLDSLLINEYKALALAISRSYNKHPVVRNDNAIDIDDIEQLALIGLWEATSTHSADKGPLGAWIRVCVHSSIATWLREYGCTVKVPRDIQRKGSKIGITDLEFVPDKAYDSLPLQIEEARKTLAAVTASLSSDASKIVSMRWGIPNGKVYKISEIAASMRLSPQYIHRVFNKTMNGLKDNEDVQEALNVIT